VDTQFYRKDNEWCQRQQESESNAILLTPSKFCINRTKLFTLSFGLDRVLVTREVYGSLTVYT